MKWNTRFTTKFPCQIPIVGAPMDDIAGGLLAFEVCRAGGLGFIGVGSGQSLTYLEDQIQIFRSQQHKLFEEEKNNKIHTKDNTIDQILESNHSYPLCLGFIGYSAFKDETGWERIQYILQTYQPAVVQFFAPSVVTNIHYNDDNKTSSNSSSTSSSNRYQNNVIMAKECCKCQVLAQVGTISEAIQAVDAGVDGLIIQGTDAGGHGVRREYGNGTLSFALDVTNRFPNIPIIAAGGIVDGRGMAAMLIAGCDGIMLGTRLWATNEAIGLDTKKQALVNANSCDDVIRTTVFDTIQNTYSETPWPYPYDSVGALRNETVALWDGRPLDLQNELGKTGGSNLVESFKLANQHGDSRTCVVLSGKGVGLINEIESAYDVVTRINTDAIQILKTKPMTMVS